MGEIRKTTVLLLAAAGFSLSAISAASAATIQIQPSHVGYLDTFDSNTDSIWLGSAGGSYGRKYLKFELPAEIGAHGNITSAVLTVAARNPAENPNAYGVLEYLPDDSWTPATLSLINQPTPSGGTYDVPMPSSAWTMYSSGDLSGAFTEGGGDTLSLRLRGHVEDTSQLVYNQVSTSAGNVYLAVEYAVPEPSSAGLLLCGLIFPLMRRSRQS